METLLKQPDLEIQSDQLEQQLAVEAIRRAAQRRAQFLNMTQFVTSHSTERKPYFVQ